MLDEAIELLTKQMLQDVFKDKQTNQNALITMTKADLYRFCIKLIKLIQRVERMDD